MKIVLMVRHILKCAWAHFCVCEMGRNTFQKHKKIVLEHILKCASCPESTFLLRLKHNL